MPSIAARNHARLSYSPYVNRAELRGRRAIEKMADDFRCLVATASGICADDLEVLGWTPAQIELHGAGARRRALALAAG